MGIKDQTIRIYDNNLHFKGFSLIKINSATERSYVLMCPNSQSITFFLPVSSLVTDSLVMVIVSLGHRRFLPGSQPEIS